MVICKHCSDNSGVHSIFLSILIHFDPFQILNKSANAGFFSILTNFRPLYDVMNFAIIDIA